MDPHPRCRSQHYRHALPPPPPPRSPEAHEDVSEDTEAPAKKRRRGHGKYPCDHPGCAKHFTRADHLARHKLNHTQTRIYECPQCDRTFVRTDLLLRHSLRHASKEQCPCTTNGAVRSGSNAHSFHPHHAHAHAHTAQPNTPTPATTSMDNGHIPITPNHPMTSVYSLNGGLPPSPVYAEITASMDADRYLLPDSIKSDISGLLSPGFVMSHSGPPGPEGGGASGYSSTTHSPPSYPPPLTTPTHLATTSPMAAIGSHLPYTSFSPPPLFDHPYLVTGSNYDWLLDDTTFSGMLESQLNTVWDPNYPTLPSGALDDAIALDLSGELSASRTPTPDTAYEHIFTPSIPASLHDIVDAATHAKVVELVKVSEHWQILSGQHIQSYIDLYWTHFHSQYPILHRPTFVPSETPAPLLLGIILIGTFYSHVRAAYDFAVASNDKLRAIVLGSEHFGAQGAPWILQTMLLTEMFGKMMSSRPQHEMAHIFHGSLITLARRSCLFAPVPASPVIEDTLEAKWKAWIRQEALKRLGFFAFMCDTQHATIFRQTALMSAFELRLPLPVDEDVWECSTAERWAAKCAEKAPQGVVDPLDKPAPTPKFLETLKGSFLPGRALPCVNPFSRFIVLHGLLSVCWDIQWRNQVFIGVTESASDDPASARVEDLLPSALETWMTRLEFNFQYDPTRSMQRTFWSCSSLHCAAFLALYTDLMDLQIYAGTKSILGRRIQASDRERATHNIRDWAGKAKGGRAATWHAIKFLRSCLLKYIQRCGEDGPCTTMEGPGPIATSGVPLDVRGVVVDGVAPVDFDAPHHARCMYLATLTAWAYAHALAPVSRAPVALLPTHPGDKRIALSSLYEAADSEAVRWDRAMSYCDAVCARRPDDLPGVVDRERTQGLVKIVADMLSLSRWEISRESAAILADLI